MNISLKKSKKFIIYSYILLRKDHFMKKKIILVLLLLFPLSPAFSLTGDEALERFRGRMQSIEKLSGVISWTTSRGATFSGNFKYLNPGKLHIKFTNPSGRTIVSNGRTLWVYSPSSNIVGVQELSDGGGSGGIASLISGYMPLLTEEGPNGYTLKLKNDNRHYQEILLLLDRSFFLKRAVFKTREGALYSFTFSDISTAATIMPGLFNFEVPANAQRVNNPLNIQ